MSQSNIKNEVLDKLDKVKDPKTLNSILMEKRLVEIEANNNECTLQLSFDGLNDEQKKNLEANILTALSYFYTKDQIKLQVSAHEAAQPKKPQVKEVNAQLEVGHEKKTGKRKLTSVKNIIAVASGKGGVGKSSFSANLAVALSNTKKSVGVLDADIYGPSLPMIMGKRDAQPKATEEKKMIPIEAHGVKFMSFGLFINEKDPVIWRGPMLGGVINQFLFDVDWGELDYLIIDLPPGTGDIQLSLSQMAEVDGAIIISTPQDVALLDAVKGLNMFRKINIPIIGMVENMSHFVCDAGKKYEIFGKGGVEKGAKELEVPFLGQIPLEIAMREGTDKGIPYMTNESYKGREVYDSFMKMAMKLNQDLLKEKTGFFSKIFN